MKTLKEKRQDFLNEVVNHFNLNNRAVDCNNKCVYSHAVNGGCAIGRKCSEELANKLDFRESVESDEVFPHLPKELQELGKDFLMAIQNLHDGQHYWTTNGPSIDGHRNIQRIEKDYCE